MGNSSPRTSTSPIRIPEGSHNVPREQSLGDFSILPQEIFLFILSYLQPDELCHAVRVSRWFKTYCEHDILWKELCKNEFSTEKNANESWKTQFKADYLAISKWDPNRAGKQIEISNNNKYASIKGPGWECVALCKVLKPDGKIHVFRFQVETESPGVMIGLSAAWEQMLHRYPGIGSHGLTWHQQTKSISYYDNRAKGSYLYLIVDFRNWAVYGLCYKKLDLLEALVLEMDSMCQKQSQWFVLASLCFTGETIKIVSPKDHPVAIPWSQLEDIRLKLHK